MKKVIDLFDNNNLPNDGVKYSELLEKFMAKFEHQLADYEYFDDILETAVNAWNFGNMSLIVPKEEFQKIISDFPKQEAHLLKKMIAHKAANFAEHTNFIVDFELEETNGDPILRVMTQPEEHYLANMMDAINDSSIGDGNFEENFINRSAIVIKPLQPFLDWYYKLYPEDMGMDYIEETNIYLVSEEIDDLEQWLKKKFDRFFKMQLEDYHLVKKEWPQRRTYKMFIQWFQVDIVTDIYDTEKRPVLKFD